MAGFLLALDQGTSSSRAIVFDLGGQIIGVAQQEFDATFPADGWVEQDPDVIWQTTISTARGALENAGVQATEIAALGITNQRETTIVWERETGRAVYPAIVWQDRRTQPFCEALKARDAEADIQARTGLVVDPYFSATKVAWILDNEPALRARAERGDLCFGTVDSYLIYRLTGGARHVTDATNASRTQLFDIREQRWSQELLALFDVPAAVLPEVLDSAADFGTVQPELLGAAIPIRGVAGDQQAALVGQACFTEGMTKSTYGTGCFVMANAGADMPVSSNALLSTVAYRLNGQTTYALEGSIFVAGQAVKWLRDELHLIRDAAESETHCRATDGDTKGVYVVPGFTGLGAPHWRPDVRGVVTGLTLASNTSDLVTATVQAVAYQTRDLLDAMAADGVSVTALRVDGGMVVNSWLCQFLADILGVQVQRPEVVETTALGAALLAAVGAGLFESIEAAADLWQAEASFDAAMPQARQAELMAGWRRAVKQALAL